MRNFLFFTFLVSVQSFLFGQIRFTTLEYPNGLKYPKAVYTNNTAIEDSVNNIIHRKVGDLETSDFCIGDFGFVQKGSHLQILFMCNCIDMPKTEHRYTFIDLDKGIEVPFYEVFEDKSREKALGVIRSSIQKANVADANCSGAIKDLGDNPNWEQLNIRLTKDGIEIRPVVNSDCEAHPIRVPYAELSEFFKYRFI